MKNTVAYQYPQQLRAIWHKGVDHYRAGNKEKATWYTEEEVSFLASIGISVQEMFDYAEDYVQHGDPDFIQAALVIDVRRAYFLNKQEGSPSSHTISMSSLPSKEASVEGIEWLPRILPKARAKLHGEMPEDLMYGCGGDRKFFKKHDIQPAEFLRIVAEYEHDDEAIIDWVKRRSADS